jgi:ankyrin repeat protein
MSDEGTKMSKEDPIAKPVYVRPAPGERGMTDLHYAAYCNDPDAVLDQLVMGVPADIRDDNGWTPLHWSIDMAQAWGQPEQVVRILLQHGASANAVDKSGLSVLMMACGRNNQDILTQLIDAGADVHARTVESTPLHEAAGCNFHEAVRTLLELGADSKEKSYRGLTPEEFAVECGFDKTVAAFKSAQRAT